MMPNSNSGVASRFSNCGQSRPSCWPASPAICLNRMLSANTSASRAPWLGGPSMTKRSKRASRPTIGRRGVGRLLLRVLPRQVAQVVANHDVAHAMADEIDLLDAVEVIDDVPQRSGVLADVLLRARDTRR